MRIRSSVIVVVIHAIICTLFICTAYDSKDHTTTIGLLHRVNKKSKLGEAITLKEMEYQNPKTSPHGKKNYAWGDIFSFLNN